MKEMIGGPEFPVPSDVHLVVSMTSLHPGIKCTDCIPCDGCTYGQNSDMCNICDPCNSNQICAYCGNGFCRCDQIIETEDGSMHKDCAEKS
jgi:hypothetical protein